MAADILAFESAPTTGPADYLSEASFWVPHFEGRAGSGHIPFIFWLVDLLRPAVFAETGSVDGGIYFAICQAVAALGSLAAGHAIPDVGRGSEADAAIQRFKAHNDRHYPGFSRVHQRAGATGIEEKSIDLLVVSAAEQPEAAAAFRETWEPMLSDRAVVLFVGPGVASTLWRDRAATLSGFEFFHGDGLAVLCYGAHAPASLRNLGPGRTNHPALPQMRSAYARLGGATRPGSQDGASEARAATLRARKLKDALRAQAAKVAKLELQLKQVGAMERDAMLRLDADRRRHSAEVAALRASNSWRFTGPARAVSIAWRTAWRVLLGQRIASLQPTSQPKKALLPAAVAPPGAQHQRPPSKRPEQAYSRPPASIRRGNGRVVFFTAVAGGYDRILPPVVIDERADYVAFTDDPRHDNGSIWQERRFDFVDADPSRTARFAKTHPHLYFADYDAAVWVDGNLQIACRYADLMKGQSADTGLVTWIHPFRDCVYDEIEECQRRNKDDPGVMQAHVQQLRAAGYPAKYGLVESSVIVFNRLGPAEIAFLTDWWRLIDNGSRRDQLSFNPALWRNPGVKVGYLGEHGVQMRNDPRFVFRRHGAVLPGGG